LIAAFINPWCWWLIGLGLTVVTIDALRQTKSISIAIMSIWATTVQIAGYGWGFLKGYWHLHVLKKDARSCFPEMFFKNRN